MSEKYDTVIIGAGLDGLVVAAYLAKAGQRALVLERREQVGGAAVTEEFSPGFKVDLQHRTPPLLPAIEKDLDLSGNGLEPVHAEAAVFAPVLDGDHVLLWRDPVRSAAELRRFAPNDAARWPAFNEQIKRAVGTLEAIYSSAPPDVLASGPGDLWSMVRVGGRLRRMGRRQMMAVLRLLPMSVAELMDEWFETDVLKGALGALGITGIRQGPMAAGTALVFLHHQVGSRSGIRAGGRVLGGAGALSQAIAACAQERGGEIRTGAQVARVMVEEGKSTGVALTSGEEIAASRVISGANPYHTFLELLDPILLPPEFVRSVRNIKFRGACAKVHLALAELPRFTGAPSDDSHLSGMISISPSLTYLERAYDDAKYGGVSNAPYLEVVVPSVADPSLAPPGKHVMSILVQYVPYHLKAGEWDDARREALGEAVVNALARYAPNLEGAVLDRHVLTPRDLEEIYGFKEGNLFHGELTMDQLLFMRPVPGWARYRTPIEGLYLCGAGTHPAGGLSGGSGYHAAGAVLADVKRGRRRTTEPLST